MHEKEIFDQILSDFVGENPAQNDNDLLKDFCAYAKKWFADKGVVGVAQTTAGFALRFANGDEKTLFTPAHYEIMNQPSMQISSGSGGSMRAPMPLDTSFRITGESGK